MQITVLKSKIHMATITDTELYYHGSISVDKELMEAAGLIAGEKVQVLNFNNSNRFETYVIEGTRGQIGLRGPAAKLGKRGDKVVIIAYGIVDQEKAGEVKPKIVFVGEKNEVK